MTYEELQSGVQALIGGRDDKTTLIQLWLNIIQKRVIMAHSFREMHARKVIYTTLDEHQYDFPTYLRIPLKLYYIDGTDSFPIKPRGWEDFFDECPNPGGLTSTKPTIWTHFGQEVFFNVPCSEANIRIDVYGLMTPSTLVVQSGVIGGNESNTLDVSNIDDVVMFYTASALHGILDEPDFAIHMYTMGMDAWNHALIRDAKEKAVHEAIWVPEPNRV